MIINSSFKDYYDCGMKLGYHGVVYNREPKYEETDVVVPRCCNWWNNNFQNKKRYDTDITPFLLSICGKLYPGVKTEEITETWNPVTFNWDKESIVKTVYSLDKIDRYKQDYEDLFNLRYRRFFTDKETQPYKSTDELHVNFRCPILLFTNCATVGNPKSQVLLNPRLADFDFQQIMGPLEVFQIIEMWFNNLTSPEKPIPNVSNENMIEAKGFDLVTSFRKEKQRKS